MVNIWNSHQSDIKNLSVQLVYKEREGSMSPSPQPPLQTKNYMGYRCPMTGMWPHLPALGLVLGFRDTGYRCPVTWMWPHLPALGLVLGCRDTGYRCPVLVYHTNSCSFSYPLFLILLLLGHFLNTFWDTFWTLFGSL